VTRRPIRSSLTTANIVAWTALFVALGGGAFAATGGSFVSGSGALHGCIAKRGGALSIVRRGRRCQKRTISLVFGATGRTGATGPTGATGQTGPPGPAGQPNPSATTVNGETVTKLYLKEPTPAATMTTQTLYSQDGLTILAQCDNAGNADLEANGPASADSALAVSGYYGSGPFGSETNSLGPSTFASLGPPNGGHASFSYENAQGQVITGDLGYAKAPVGSFNGCTFFGVVTSG